MKVLSRQFDAVDLPALQRLARAMVEHLQPPQAIGLTGTLGAGKTTLVQAIAQAAGIDVADVTSPTFTLLQTYQGTIRIHHLDAYRVADEDEFVSLGVAELLADADAWTLVEWADRVASVLPDETLWIELASDGDAEQRTIRFRFPAAISAEIDRIGSF